jgi:hypothetical protein
LLSAVSIFAWQDKQSVDCSETIMPTLLDAWAL